MSSAVSPCRIIHSGGISLPPLSSRHSSCAAGSAPGVSPSADAASVVPRPSPSPAVGHIWGGIHSGLLMHGGRVSARCVGRVQMRCLADRRTLTARAHQSGVDGTVPSGSAGGGEERRSSLHARRYGRCGIPYIISGYDGGG